MITFSSIYLALLMYYVNIHCFSEAPMINENGKIKQHFIINHYNGTSESHQKYQFDTHNIHSRVKKQTVPIKYIDTMTGHSPFKLYCPINGNLSFVWTKDDHQLMMDYSYMFLMPPYLFINEPQNGRDSGIFECNMRRYQFVFPIDETTQQRSEETNELKSLISKSLAVGAVIVLLLLSYIVIKISKVHTQAISNYVKIWVMLNNIDLKEAVREEMTKAKEEEEEMRQALEDDIANYAFAALLK